MSWESNIRKVVPYVPGEQPKETNLIKLNTNENPYPPCKAVQDELNKMAMDYDVLRKYPKPACDQLVEALSKYYGFPEDQIFVGVGSDDVLSMAFLTCFNSEKPILFPDITYSFYDVWAEVYRIPYKTIPLTESFEIDFKDYQIPNGGIVIANPNAPTGIAKPISEIEELVKANPDSVVIVDEAYVDFGAESALPLVDKYDNVLVVRTYSKSRQMAGMRIGAAFGNPKLIKFMQDVKYSVNSYTMNETSLRLGAIALEDEAYFKECLRKIKLTREYTVTELEKLGFKVLPSCTNFVFATHPDRPAAELYKMLRENKILVRYFNKPRIDNFLRITIGTDEEMQKFIEVLSR